MRNSPSPLSKPSTCWNESTPRLRSLSPLESPTLPSRSQKAVPPMTFSPLKHDQVSLKSSATQRPLLRTCPRKHDRSGAHGHPSRSWQPPEHSPVTPHEPKPARRHDRRGNQNPSRSRRPEIPRAKDRAPHSAPRQTADRSRRPVSPLGDTFPLMFLILNAGTNPHDEDELQSFKEPTRRTSSTPVNSCEVCCLLDSSL